MSLHQSFGMDPRDVANDYALQFLDNLSLETEVQVPYPVQNHPDWTTIPFTGVGIPATFDSQIRLTNPLLEPVLYAAAVDTIRMTNYYFNLVGQYNEGPLTEEHVIEMQRLWPSTVRPDGKRVGLFPVDEYPLPPDGRILYVKEAMGDPTDRLAAVLWIRACRSVTRMNDSEWNRYLTYTRNHLIEMAEKREGNDGSWLILELFKRYLVWHELVMGVSERARYFEDEQPSADELEEFFDRDSVKEKGATLVEICHAFPNARDVQVLVYRVEHFATLTPQPSVKTALQIDDPVESRYIRKPIPSEQGIKATVANILHSSSDSVSYSELAGHYWPSTDTRRLVASVLNTMARKDVTTGNFILPDDGPSVEEIQSKLTDLDALTGFTLTELAGRLPNRVSNLDQLLQNTDGFVYFDHAENLYFTHYIDQPEEETLILSGEDSITHHNQARISHPDYIRDVTTGRYVLRTEQSPLSDITGNETRPDDSSSSLPELASTIDWSSPSPPEAVNSLHVPVATVETVPVDPPATRNTLQIGVFATIETTPVVPPAAAVPPTAATGSAVTPAGESAPTEPRGGGRPPKRGATEPPESKGTKKPRKNPKIQCSARTLKNKRCKKQKDREAGDEDWHCAVHKQN
ncbi:hypothetical protein C7974DRAFT_171921 [Boeremia exigua]|uniref:uncharacterized protein n=1 Tax=Boeremia exigua TaxID=749465 RepID=UPI001E8CFAEF|nr:uncharacterized protein C7974DRAFT_171921 [Boeremia exigua]KAH6633456.1 hypothetical protein C7974DRAFT_171921 [Boeremia exigua]